MSIDPGKEIHLDANKSWDLVGAEVKSLESEGVTFVTAKANLDALDRVGPLLASLRASGVGAVMLLHRGDETVEEEEALTIFQFLRDSDQMLLHNFLELCEGWVPPEYVVSLQTECKFELKWFREWLTAANDTRIYKYPSLPWRSFIRKVNTENYQFAERFLQLVSEPNNVPNVQVMSDLFRRFLVAKKQVLCVFPKNWGKMN
jgi:hypothetical protein